MSDPFDFLPAQWSDTEKELWGDFDQYGAFDDQTAQALFNEGYFNLDISTDERIAIREALDDYMMATYGIDFSEVFDWEAWREAYE